MLSSLTHVKGLASDSLCLLSQYQLLLGKWKLFYLCHGFNFGIEEGNVCKALSHYTL